MKFCWFQQMENESEKDQNNQSKIPFLWLNLRLK